jgi:hypothetical protein
MRALGSTPTLWPRKAGELAHRAAQVKAQNPLDKPGIVGALCRAYSVYASIDEFIPDVYSPVEQSWGGKDRYTYNYGSGSAGSRYRTWPLHLQPSWL